MLEGIRHLFLRHIFHLTDRYVLNVLHMMRGTICNKHELEMASILKELMLYELYLAVHDQLQNSVLCAKRVCIMHCDDLQGRGVADNIIFILCGGEENGFQNK